MLEVTAITTGLKWRGSKNCRTEKNILPWRNIKDHKEKIFLNANSSEILEGEGKEHEITEKHCKKR